MRRFAWVSLFALLAACGSLPRERAQKPIGRSSIVAAPTESGDGVDADDKCRVIAQGCFDAFEDDGCPDVTIAALGVCAPDERTKLLLDEAARDMSKDARYGRVAIVGTKDGAQCVFDAFVAHGIDAQRLKVVEGPGDIAFEVEMWDGKECKPTGEPVYM